MGKLLAEPGKHLGRAPGWPAVATFVPIPPRWRSPTRATLGSWKARHVALWAGQTPFVWFEDDADAVSRLPGQPGLGCHLMVKVDPVIGLTGAHVKHARAWLDNLHQ